MICQWNSEKCLEYNSIFTIAQPNEIEETNTGLVILKQVTSCRRIEKELTNVY